MQNGAPRREATASALGGHFISRDWQILAWQWQCGIASAAGTSGREKRVRERGSDWKRLRARVGPGLS